MVLRHSKEIYSSCIRKKIYNNICIMKRSPSQSISPKPKKPKCKYEFELVKDSNEIEDEVWVKVSEDIAPANFGTQVSNKGRIKSHTGVITTGSVNKDGYAVVGIDSKQQKLHRVIMKSFGIKPPSPEHKYVNHIDLNRSNNNLENLEWVTHKQNMDHSYANNEDRRSSAGAMSRPVKGRKIGESEWTKYDSVMDAARKLNLAQGHISRACRKGYKHKGYYFEFSAPNEPPLLEGEIWKKCKNGGGAEVSNKGRFKDIRGVVKTPRPEADGYCRVGIGKKNKSFHTLIAECFLPPPRPDQTQVNHIDHNPSNNVLDNLEWTTTSNNINLSYKHGRKSSAEKQSKKVRARKIGETGWTTYNSGQDASRALGIPSYEISKMCRKASEPKRNHPME